MNYISYNKQKQIMITSYCTCYTLRVSIPCTILLTFDRRILESKQSNNTIHHHVNRDVRKNNTSVENDINNQLISDNILISHFVTTTISGISKIPDFMNCIESPLPGCTPKITESDRFLIKVSD